MYGKGTGRRPVDPLEGLRSVCRVSDGDGSRTGGGSFVVRSTPRVVKKEGVTSWKGNGRLPILSSLKYQYKYLCLSSKIVYVGGDIQFIL